MRANILSLHAPFASGWDLKFVFYFSEIAMLHIKLTRIKHLRVPYKQIFCPFTHPRPLGGVKWPKPFSEDGHVAYQIKRKEVLNIMQVKCCSHAHS